MSALLAKLPLRRAAVVVALLLVLALPFALKRDQEQVPGKERGLPSKKLVIVSPHAESIRREFGWAFSDWTAENEGFTVEFEWLDVGGTLQAIRYVDDQFEQTPGGIGIDLFFGGGVDPYLHLAGKGLLHRCSIPEDVLEPIPRTYAGMEIYDKDQEWFGACLAGFGLLYNKPVLEFLEMPEPEAWADLGRPGYFTWISSADPRKSGSMHMVYEIILQAYGWEKGWETVMRIGANCRAFSRQASDVPREVSAGEAACGMAIDTYALRAVAQAGGDRLAFRLPERLTVVNPDGIGVLKGAPHVELAESFVEFVLSERGQKLWILRAGAPDGPRRHQLYRLPLIPGLAARYPGNAVVTFDPFEFEGGVEFDSEKKNVRWRILNDLIGARIIDPHPELAKAWQVLRSLPEGHPGRRKLLSPPVSEEELLRLAETKWDDPYFRAEKIAGWSGQASNLYVRLAEEH